MFDTAAVTAPEGDPEAEPVGDPPAGPRRLRPAVAAGLAVPAGPALLAAAVALLSGDGPTDPSSRPAGPASPGPLSARELVEVLVALKRVAGFVYAAQLAGVVALDRALQPAHPPGQGPDAGSRDRLPAGRRAADELAAALVMAPRTASELVGLAVRADRDLPQAMDALAEGRMDPTQLRDLAAATRALPAALVARVADVAVRSAPTRTPAQLRARVAAEAARLDPEHAARAAAVGRSDRDVVLRPSPLPGCRRLVADLPAEAAAACWLALNGTARGARARSSSTGERRTLPQLRADLAASLLTGTADPAGAGTVPRPERLRALAEVHVVVAADALRGGGGSAPGTGPDGGTGGGTGGGSGGGGPDRGGRSGPALSGDDRRAGSSPPTTGSRTTATLATTAASATTSGSPTPAGAPPPSTARPVPSGSRAALPAHVPGMGPLDLDTARVIATQARWRRLVVDGATGRLLNVARSTLAPPTRQRAGGLRASATRSSTAPSTAQPAPALTGADPRTSSRLRTDPRWAAVLARGPLDGPEDSGTQRYRPRAGLRRHVQARDDGCVAPACHHPVDGTQLDHTIDFGPGPTSEQNLGCICPRFHNAKTHGGWALQQGEPGAFTWTSPTGRSYRRPAGPVLPGWPESAPVPGQRSP